MVFCPPSLIFHHREAHVSILGEPQVRGQSVHGLARRNLLAETYPCGQPWKVPLGMTQFQRGQGEVVNVGCEPAVDLSRTRDPFHVPLEIDTEYAVRFL